MSEIDYTVCDIMTAMNGMDYTSSYIIYGIMCVVVFAICGYFLYGMFKKEKSIHDKKKSKRKEDQEEYAQIKKNNRRTNLTWAIAFGLAVLCIFGMGVWGVIPSIICVCVARVIVGKIADD